MNAKQLKRAILIAWVISLPLIVAAHEPAKGVKFFNGTWSQVLRKAKEENKTIFVDFYAEWCGPCKWMTKEVFTDSVVGDYFNRKIVAFKVDAEKEEPELVKQLSLQAYPTLALFDANGNVLARTEGAMEGTDLIKFVESVSAFEQSYKAYKADSTNPEKLMVYIEALRFKDAKQIGPVVNQYLDNLDPSQLKAQGSWNLVVNYVEDYNSKVLTFISQNSAWYKAHCANFESGYRWFLNAIMNNAVESQDETLLAKFKEHYLAMRRSTGTMGKGEPYFNEAIDILYFKQVGDTITYSNKLISFVEHYYSQDWKFISANALEILETSPSDKGIKAKCLAMATKALALNKNKFTNWVMASALQAENAGGKNAKAIRSYLLKVLGDEHTSFLLQEGGLSLSFDESNYRISLIPTKIN